MTDLIKRQDAIEVINKLMEIHFDRKVVLGKVWQQIKDLPSAQQWIPVEKETPILPNIVLVCDSLGKILFDSYIDGSWTYCPCVVAWMPMPEQYKGENAND